LFFFLWMSVAKCFINLCMGKKKDLFINYHK
jgi:hypothetical protein